MNDIQEKPTNHQVADTPSSRPASRGEIYAGVGLFLFLGLLLSFMELPYEWGWIERNSTLGSYIFASTVHPTCNRLLCGLDKRISRAGHILMLGYRL